MWSSAFVTLLGEGASRHRGDRAGGSASPQSTKRSMWPRQLAHRPRPVSAYKPPRRRSLALVALLPCEGGALLAESGPRRLGRLRECFLSFPPACALTFQSPDGRSAFQQRHYYCSPDRVGLGRELARDLASSLRAWPAPARRSDQTACRTLEVTLGATWICLTLRSVCEAQALSPRP